MGTMKDAKTYGGIGAILMLLGTFVPFIGLVGLILLFISVKTIADITNDRSIFDHFLYYFILAIIAIIVTGAMMFTALFTVGFDPTALTAGFGIIAALIVGWILFIFSSLYLKKCYNSIFEKTNVDAFRTAGKLYFIGAITMIIVIGFIIMFVARIFEIIAYFGLPDEYAPQTMSQPEQNVEKIV